MISIKTIEKDDDRGRQFWIVICLRALITAVVWILTVCPHVEREARTWVSPWTVSAQVHR